MILSPSLFPLILLLTQGKIGIVSRSDRDGFSDHMKVSGWTSCI